MITLPIPALLFLAGFLFAAGVTFGYMLCGALVSAAAENEPVDDSQPRPGMWW